VQARAEAAQRIDGIEWTLRDEPHQVVERLVDSVQLQPRADSRGGDRGGRCLRLRFAPHDLGLVQLPHAQVAGCDVDARSWSGRLRQPGREQEDCD
jgi:hypothetical protein